MSAGSGAVKATITISAASAEAEQVTLQVDFDPPLDRENPSIVAHYAVCALEAIGFGAQSLGASATDAPEEPGAGVKHAAG